MDSVRANASDSDADSGSDWDDVGSVHVASCGRGTFNWGFIVKKLLFILRLRSEFAALGQLCRYFVGAPRLPG